ncbi:LapA family protein [candidate division KSB1 bacterium]|nr:LapA family protein [candidate division KSB1 bacterium]
MWIIRWIVWVLLILFVIYFGAENSSQTVQISFLKWETKPLQLWIVMYLCFGAGILVWLFASIFKVLQAKNEIRKLNKENTSLKKEIYSLRNISIEEETSGNQELEGDIL